jgi:hypothetical protein
MGGSLSRLAGAVPEKLQEQLSKVNLRFSGVGKGRKCIEDQLVLSLRSAAQPAQPAPLRIV